MHDVGVASPLVSFLSDFGTRDPWVAICKGVVLTIAPDAGLLDVSHEIAPFDVLAGALILADVLPELPVGVHLAVVDPGVGSERRAIGLRTRRGDVLVGPDNGLLVPAADRLGGVVAGHELREERYRRASVSRTFHGRDVFAPAAGHLAAGVALDRFGPPIQPATLVRIDIPVAEPVNQVLRTSALLVDSYGNVALAGAARDLEEAAGPLLQGSRLVLEWWSDGGAAQRRDATWAKTFSDGEPGAAMVYADSLGRLAIAMNQASAADELGIDIGASVNIRRAR
jgi:S-adenosylmethionine hydrolase